jgi:hypothetical protein
LSPDDLPTGYNAVRIYEHGTAVLDTGITLTEPDMIDIQFTYSQYNSFNVSCVDCFNGTITTTVTGGTAPYTYQWEDANNSTTANLSNLNGGDYPLFVTDAHSCRADNIAQLTMPTPKDWSRSGNANIDTSEFIGSTDTSALRFKTNNQEVLRLNGNGNVGIGTAFPTEKLEVNGVIKAQGLKINDFSINFRPADANNPELITLGRDFTADQGSLTGTLLPGTCIDPLKIQRATVFPGGAVFKVKQINQNNLYCGGSDPTLYVGLYGCNGAIEVNQNEEDGIQSYQTYQTSKLLLNTLCGKDVIVGNSSGGNLIANFNLGVGVVNPAEKFEVDGNGLISGKLGIGNVVPLAALHIKNGYANSIIIENTQSAHKMQIESAGGAGRLINSGSMYIYLNSKQDSRDNTSNFIIAKNASYYGQAGIKELFRVDNDGTGYIKDLWVKAPASNGSFPDFVFAKDYKLRSLEDVKTYYLEHQHLPDMPSANEIEAAGGISMTQMLINLTKIVEENTIYLTQQNEQIKLLQDENLKLKKSIDKLTKK